jgi:hypothetical protein
VAVATRSTPSGRRQNQVCSLTSLIAVSSTRSTPNIQPLRPILSSSDWPDHRSTVNYTVVRQTGHHRSKVAPSIISHLGHPHTWGPKDMVSLVCPSLPQPATVGICSSNKFHGLQGVDKHVVHEMTGPLSPWASLQLQGVYRVTDSLAGQAPHDPPCRRLEWRRLTVRECKIFIASSTVYLGSYWAIRGVSCLHRPDLGSESGRQKAGSEHKYSVCSRHSLALPDLITMNPTDPVLPASKNRTVSQHGVILTLPPASGCPPMFSYHPCHHNDATVGEIRENDTHRRRCCVPQIFLNQPRTFCDERP